MCIKHEGDSPKVLWNKACFLLQLADKLQYYKYFTTEEGGARDSRLKDKGMGESSDTTTCTDFNNNEACTLTFYCGSKMRIWALASNPGFCYRFILVVLEK